MGNRKLPERIVTCACGCGTTFSLPSGQKSRIYLNSEHYRSYRKANPVKVCRNIHPKKCGTKTTAALDMTYPSGTHKRNNHYAY